jgi:DNA-binding transcriptional LysR family regulator
MIDEISGDFLQWLRGFYFVAKSGSVTQASFEMRRNQPTISHQIKCLEREFGVTLFDRSKRRMELTPEGEMVLEKVISIFEVIKEMKSEIGEAPLQEKGDVTIATTHAVVHYFLPAYITPYQKRYPNVHFKVIGGGMEMILDGVESAGVDFGIASLHKVKKTLSYHTLFSTRPILVAQADNPYFRKKAPTLNQIARAPFISFPQSSTIAAIIKNRFRRVNLDLNIVLVLNNFEEVKRYVSLGVGVSILDDFTISDADRDTLDIYDLSGYFRERKYGLIIRKKKYLSPHVKAFIRTIRQDIPVFFGE